MADEWYMRAIVDELRPASLQRCPLGLSGKYSAGLSVSSFASERPNGRSAVTGISGVAVV